MSDTIQTYLSKTTTATMDEFITAYLRIPEDKRTWNPEDKARSAHNLVAECALINHTSADLLTSRVWPGGGMDAFMGEMGRLSGLDWESLSAMLKENTHRVAETIAAVPDEALETSIAMPWGSQTITEIMAYPNSNMNYHLGQINYIASMLGCLD